MWFSVHFLSTKVNLSNGALKATPDGLELLEATMFGNDSVMSLHSIAAVDGLIRGMFELYSSLLVSELLCESQKSKREHWSRSRTTYPQPSIFWRISVKVYRKISIHCFSITFFERDLKLSALIHEKNVPSADLQLLLNYRYTRTINSFTRIIF